ncbi:hypothetical protein A8C32_16885 [Flavivirga aquatica]|uniref:Secretion system C-terminal sorting domain-containing protein n=1 Tax=Flavivirga aquatica TaxID=1849968 RepID=A0A1E5T8E0_9FLAO|nr:T9SS type A sorting domain-containing protein [Flavivirga aquatica]OEK07655.1 hypothetical protein A8C32_16885 [Flavivirga aquatica]
MKKITFLILTICLTVNFGQAQCDSQTVAHYNTGDFPFTSTTGVEVTMGGTNSGTLGPYSAFGCSPATIEANTIRLDPGDELILNFSEAISKITLAVGVMNTYENGTITTNNGDPILSSNCSGDLAITGNAFEQVGALASPVITVTIPNGATSITISSLASTQGGGNGVFTVDVLDCIEVYIPPCDSETVAHYNIGDFPFTSTTGVEVTMGGTNSGTLGPYSAFGCSPATIEANTIRLDPGDELILNFSETITKITLAVGVMNTYENGTITTNNGDPILSSNCNGDLAITGNAFEQVGALASPVITVSIPGGATSITISSLASTQGGGNGVFTVDVLDCIEPGGTLSVEEQSNFKNVFLSPNPSNNFIKLSGLVKSENYKVYDYLGKELLRGSIENKEKIDVQNLKNGLYFMKFQNGNIIKFIKK